MKRSSSSPSSAGLAGKSRIFVVEDHPITRAGYAAMITHAPELMVCGESGTAADAFTSIVELKPDLLLLDIGLKASNGLDLARSVLSVIPDLRILVVSMQDERFYAERAFQTGARGYLMKDEAISELLCAIRTVLAGERYLSAQLKKSPRLGQDGENEPRDFSLVGTLNGRELEIFELVGAGYPTREIALRLKLSAKTVDFYREKVKQKLSFGSSAEVLRYAIRWVTTQGLIIK